MLIHKRAWLKLTHSLADWLTGSGTGGVAPGKDGTKDGSALGSKYNIYVTDAEKESAEERRRNSTSSLLLMTTIVIFGFQRTTAIGCLM